MSYANYSRVEPFSPLHNGQSPIHRSPESAASPQPWDTPDGDLSSPHLEMHAGATSYPSIRPQIESFRSSSATLYPRPSSESQSFLHVDDASQKVDTRASRVSLSSILPSKANTGKQLRQLLIGSSTRFFITASLCIIYIAATRIWQNKGVISEAQKRIYNTITTAISIALGLNIASAFKDMAINMRWPILASKKRNLVELDLILHADSLSKLGKLALVSRRPAVFLTCVAWLLVNVLAQTGIAALSLTYGFDVDYNAVRFVQGEIAIPDMQHYYPNGNNTQPTGQDEEYIAHIYGAMGPYAVNSTDYLPKPGDIYKSDMAALFIDDNSTTLKFVFTDSPPNLSLDSQFSVWTNRTIEVSYACDSYRVTANGDGSHTEITVNGKGDMLVSNQVAQSTTFFTNEDSVCSSGDPRCSVVEIFEASDTDPWYYMCNITLGTTQGDPKNLSFISDDMAYTATSSIAQIGYTDDDGQEAQIYPQHSMWGSPLRGDNDTMGFNVALFSLGSIVGASLYNPQTTYEGMAPRSGWYLHLGHGKSFYVILGLICASQLVFCVVVAVVANRVRVGPEEHLAMSLLLREVAERLHGVSGGRDTRAFREAKRNTMVRYERLGDGRWGVSLGEYGLRDG